MTTQTKNESKVRKSPQRRSVKKASDKVDAQKSSLVKKVDAGRTPQKKSRATKL